MSNFKVGGKTLLEIGYPKSPVFRLAMKVMDEHFNHLTRDEAIDLLKNVLADPDAYVNDALLGPVAAPAQDAVQRSGLAARADADIGHALAGFRPAATAVLADQWSWRVGDVDLADPPGHPALDDRAAA